MVVSIEDFMTRVANDLSETSNEFLSGAWTLAEMISYLNYAERDFLIKTGAVKYDTTVILPGGSGILIERPDNTMDIDRVSLDGKRLLRQSSINLELEDRHWRSHTVGHPAYYHEDNIPISYIELNKIPSTGGTLRVFSSWLPDPYTTIFENLHLPDHWEPYLRWKVLALALAKDCEDQDIQRSSYADQRYMVGVQLAQRLVKGITDTGLRG
jgi:hypothetical protein